MTKLGIIATTTDPNSITNPTVPKGSTTLHRGTKMTDNNKRRPNCKIMPNEPNRCQAKKYAPRTNTNIGGTPAKPNRPNKKSSPVQMAPVFTKKNPTSKARKHTKPPNTRMTQSQPRRTQQKITIRGTELTNQKHRDKNQSPQQTRLRHDQGNHHSKPTQTRPTHNSRSRDSPVKGKQKP